VNKAHILEDVIKLMERLRSAEGCPWDREQSHISLKRNLLEECYEFLEAVDLDDPKRMREELGDLLMQVIFHAQIAKEADRFTIEDVARSIIDKLVKRHPHVFSDAVASSTEDVRVNWDLIKEKERGQASILEGVPKDMPALLRSQLIQDRVSRVGFDWENANGVLHKVAEEIGEIENARSHQEREHEIGDLLFSLVNLARWMGIQAEQSLSYASSRFTRRFLYMENTCWERGVSFRNLPLKEKEELWLQAKEFEVIS
jgi:tetrapyrrole methylase family protein/MazG family protein